MKKIFLGLILAAVCFALVYWLCPSCYEIQCVFVVASDNIQTNVCGEVVQPKVGIREGLHEDCSLTTRERLSEYLSSRFSGDPLKDGGGGVTCRFLERMPQWLPSAEIVSNAVNSICFDVAGNPIVIVRMSARSTSLALGVDLLKFVADDFCRCLNGFNEYRMGKALAWFEAEKKRRNERQDNVAEIDEEMKRVKMNILGRNTKICILKLFSKRVLWPW